MSSAPQPGLPGSPGPVPSQGSAAPLPAQSANLTGYAPPAGTDEVVEELAEEIADEVIDESSAEIQVEPPPVVVPVAGVPDEPQRRVVYTAPPPPGSVPPASIPNVPSIDSRVTYTATPVIPGPNPPAAPAAAAPAETTADEEIIEDAVVADVTTAVAPAPAAPAAPPVEVDLDAFTDAVATAPKPRPRPVSAKAAAPPSSLQSTSIPILMTVGLLLQVPGVWAVMVKMGKEVPGSDRAEAATMANVMLMCMPLGLILISGAVYFFIQVRDEKRAREERHQFALAKIAAAETARVAAEQSAIAQQSAVLAQQTALLQQAQMQLAAQQAAAQQPAVAATPQGPQVVATPAPQAQPTQNTFQPFPPAAGQ